MHQMYANDFYSTQNVALVTKAVIF